MEKNTLKIPIKINEYEELFNEIDFNPMDKREINGGVDDFIYKTLIKSYDKKQELSIELEINIPIEAKDSEKENLSIMGIRNYYQSFFEHRKKMNTAGIARIIYYMITALILLSGWYVIKGYKGETFLAAILNAGGTVLLWEIMSLVFIERKNATDRALLKKKILKMDIKFNYLES